MRQTAIGQIGHRVVRRAATVSKNVNAIVSTRYHQIVEKFALIRDLLPKRENVKSLNAVRIYIYIFVILFLFYYN